MKTPCPFEKSAAAIQPQADGPIEHGLLVGTVAALSHYFRTYNKWGNRVKNYITLSCGCQINQTHVNATCLQHWQELVDLAAANKQAQLEREKLKREAQKVGEQ